MDSDLAQHIQGRVASLLKAVYDQSSHLGGILGLDGSILHANRLACELIGVSVSEVLGKPLWETPWATHSTAEAEKIRHGVECAARGVTVHMETTHRGADGTLHLMDLSVKPVYDERGAPSCLMMEAREITEERRAEAGRSANESMLRSLFRATPIGITFNVARMVHTVNDSMCRLTGYDEQEIVGKSARLFYESQEEFERVAGFLYEPLPRVGRTSVETRFRRKDGQIITVILTAAMIDMKNPDAGYAVVVQDITEQKRAEEALRQSESRFRGMMEQSPFSIQVLYLTGEIVEVNSAFCELWGTSRENLKGYNILQDAQIEKLGFMPVVREALMGHRVRTPVVDYDVASTLGAGSRKVVQGVFYPIRDPGGILRSVILVHIDLTERTQAEEERNKLQEQLLQATKMEAVGRLAGGIAHDFNNLLTTISGNTEMARMDADSFDLLSEHLQEITKAAESAATLTRQLLAFSRRQVIAPRAVNLNELIEHLQKMLSRLIGEDIALKTVLAPDLGTVMIDPGQFEQVLVNLTVNARDAMPDGGTLLVETSNAELDADYCAHHPQVAPGRFVLLAVSDTGRGMSPEVRERIFEPFYTTKAQGKGTGLGLATIFGIAKQAGGAIEVYSEPALGATFKIYLPRVEMPSEKLSAAKAAEAPARGSETILLVEDNASVLAFAQSLLGRLGYVVLPAADGAAAIALAERHRGHIDLLMTDVVMPGMNGRELAERLTAMNPELKVLFTSGYAENVIVHHGVLEEDINFIGKPYSLQTLSKKIRTVLATRAIAH